MVELLKKFTRAHLLKLVDKMGKYEMDLASIVADTERTRFCPLRDRWTDGPMDRWTDGRLQIILSQLR